MAEYSPYRDYPAGGQGGGNDASTMGTGPSMSQYSGAPLVAGAYAAGHHGGGGGAGAPSVTSSGSVYPETQYGGTSVSGGDMSGGRAQRMTKQQEAARAYAETHPNAQSQYSSPNSSSPPPTSMMPTPHPASATSGESEAPRQPLAVVNPENNDAESIAPSVLQHRDGGRLRVLNQDPEDQAEIPPSYDSIPPDER